MNVKTVYFVRHGEDMAGSHAYFQGADSPLTEKGKAQARFMAKRVSHLPLAQIITSPMKRAKDTATIIQQEVHTPLVDSSLFREYLPPTSLINTQRTSVKGREYVREMLEHLDDADWHYEDEDNYHDLHERAIRAMRYLTQQSAQCLLVVTHAGFLRVLLSCMMHNGAPQPRTTHALMRFLDPKHTGVTVCSYNGVSAATESGWRLITWNDRNNLADTDAYEPA